MKNVQKETNARGKSGFGTSDSLYSVHVKEATNSAICASVHQRERPAALPASPALAHATQERERTVFSSSGSGSSVVAVVHETGERKSAMELEALVMVNHCFHPHKLYKLYKFKGKE